MTRVRGNIEEGLEQFGDAGRFHGEVEIVEGGEEISNRRVR